MAIPTSPSTLRTPRTRALEIGTNPAGFSEGPVFNTQAGAPAAMAGGTYQSLPPLTSPVGSPINAVVTFNVK